MQLEELTKYRKLFKDELVSFDTKRQEIRWIGLEEPDDKVLGADSFRTNTASRNGSSSVSQSFFDNKSTRDGVQVRMKTVCPWCGGENTMRLFGARSTTLSSALFGHLNSSPSNDDHKLIAFSDSVQDAAHRAGFIEARNYLYTVRQATAGVIRQIRPGERQSLEGLLNRITDHWLGLIGKSNELRQSTSALIRERADDIAAARFVTTFVPSDMLWRRTWLSFAERASDLWQSPAKGGFNPKNDNAERLYAIVPPLTEHDESGRPDTYWGKFVKHVQARLRWEAFIELTLRSHSGRTLELAGIGAVEPDAYLIKEAAARFQKTVFERVGSLRDKPIEDFERFITGFLFHQKSRGAFDVSGVPGLEDFVSFTETGNDWVFNNSPCASDLREAFSARPLRFIMRIASGFPSKGFFDTICPASTGSETWYTVWLTNVFGAELDIVAGCEDIYGAMLDVLRELDIVRFVTMTTQNGADVYLLNPQMWYVSRDLERAVCPDCGRWHVIERNNDVHELWRGMPCLSKQCNAASHKIEPFREEESLYQGTPFRATAREHTADVPGETRGRIERSFIHGKEPWDVNLLSATPTLEMGIDIGDLSSVLLGSMPPKEASYQQRIGRAGRRDGNALAMTICSNDAHSNYFWTDPDKMLAGAVEPPGVFLHAMAVLERQLFALAITRWMTAYPSAEIPQTLDTILKEKKWDGQTYAPDSFPMGFLDYAMNEAETLHRDFCTLFTQKENAPDGLPMQFSTEEKERLRQFLVGDTSGRTSLRDRLIGETAPHSAAARKLRS